MKRNKSLFWAVLVLTAVMSYGCGDIFSDPDPSSSTSTSNPSNPSNPSTDESISVSPSSLTFGSAGGKQDVKVICSVAWSATAQQDWIKMTHESGTDIVTVICASGSKAEGSILFTTASKKFTVKVSRTGGTTTFTSDGLFSVSATKKVKFSPGNLQYNAASGSWRFAEHQYDYIGESNKNISQNYGGWIDLFGWGTSGWKSGAVAYQPWASNRKDEDYWPGGVTHGYGLTGTYANADWGVYNAIGNSGGKKTWRTLTQAEWEYLTNTRPPKNNYAGNGRLLSCYGNIDGINGFFLFPDDWDFANGIEYNYAMVNYYTNTFTKAQWSQMEKLGVVFLPAAGYRVREEKMDDKWNHYEEVNVYRVGTRGEYWLATSWEGWTSVASVEFKTDDDLTVGQTMASPSYGFSVRLVQNAK